jgi:hypothetical protein
LKYQPTGLEGSAPIKINAGTGHDPGPILSTPHPHTISSYASSYYYPCNYLSVFQADVFEKVSAPKFCMLSFYPLS